MIGLPITSSVVAAKALGLEPTGVPSKIDTVCSLCGLSIKAGDLAAPFGMSQTFTDDASLAARGTGHTCGYCPTVITKEGLRLSGFGVFSEEGFKPFRKWAEIADALMNPPKPPFVMVYATANNQHMAWRAPVNFSQDAFRVRVGLRDLLIRKKHLAESIEACRVLGNASGVATASTGTKKTLPNPFVVLSSDLKDIDHGRLTSKLLSDRYLAEEGPNERAALEQIKGLTLGETWALRFVLTPNAGNHSSPQQ